MIQFGSWQTGSVRHGTSDTQHHHLRRFVRTHKKDKRKTGRQACFLRSSPQQKKRKQLQEDYGACTPSLVPVEGTTWQQSLSLLLMLYYELMRRKPMAATETEIFRLLEDDRCLGHGADGKSGHH